MGYLRGSPSYPNRNYLRGSLTKVIRASAGGYVKPTLQNQLNALKQQVSKNKPEKQYFIDNTQFISTGTTPEHFDYDVSDTLRISSSFRDFVNGDRWTNHYLELNFGVDFTALNKFRFVVYVAKKAGTALNGTYAGVCTGPFDPESFWLIHDEYINAGAANQFTTLKRYVNLKQVQSVYNASAGAWERGRIRVCIITDPTSTPTLVAQVGTKLCFSNK